MSRDTCNLKQRPDDSWTIEVQESTLIMATPLGPLSKEQAIRETLRRGYKHITVMDKEVLAAIASGKARPPE